jgi:predicted metal-dependent hydrolase
MPMPTISQVPNLGPVVFATSRRAKHLRITIRPDRTVRLTIPKRVPLKKARQFLHSKIPWIKKHLQRLEELEKTEKNIQLPPIDKPKAASTLIRRLRELADIHNLEYKKVSIRNQKTKWGSCSAKDNISLNINLTRLPTELMDYVLLHELLHTRIKNHSKEFWSELDKYIGGSAKELSKRLRKHRLDVLSRAANDNASRIPPAHVPGPDDAAATVAAVPSASLMR